MGQSVLVFISHSSDDKESIIEPLVRDLEDCYINVWIDKRKIFPGDNLRKSIFRDGLDKADIALIFFTENSLNSSWVDKEIKHVLKDEKNKGNDYDLKKIISIFDSEETYFQISERYPELTDDLLHLMPNNYSRIDLGQLLSAIWSKHLTLQGGDTETQRQILAKEKEIFQRDKEIQLLKNTLDEEKSKNSQSSLHSEFESYLNSRKINAFINERDEILKSGWLGIKNIAEAANARAFGLIDLDKNAPGRAYVTEKGRSFFSWYLLNHEKLES
ncbi:toll/interleukin-1 receptor domain-containing protein [Pseudomonas koreensis]|uniref:toll/interleukin-1 receptor domain-containing protein n=1 Tax=Pseudomonas koreensis TaxID=198620 RepID=UPI0021C5936F|nr:toll/interleukin-1 receptor domain-containing protein [Pseudomonas koreensis]MCU0091940.1 toll/interleukin-1 receptor domain-containing protein [Pseudomonas koreensis]